MPEQEEDRRTETGGTAESRRGKRIRDLTDRRFGRLTALYPTQRRDEKGSVYWRCRCECGKEAEVTEDGLIWGNNLSCGCLKREMQRKIYEKLHCVEGTCLEILEKRKHRSDNTSGFRGVSPIGKGRYRAYIGFQGERYYLGSFGTFEEAVEARLEAERQLHGSFLKAYYEWKERAERNPGWEEENPFYFRVRKRNGGFEIIRKEGQETEGKREERKAH